MSPDRIVLLPYFSRYRTLHYGIMNEILTASIRKAIVSNDFLRKLNRVFNMQGTSIKIFLGFYSPVVGHKTSVIRDIKIFSIL